MFNGTSLSEQNNSIATIVLRIVKCFAIYLKMHWTELHSFTLPFLIHFLLGISALPLVPATERPALVLF